MSDKHKASATFAQASGSTTIQASVSWEGIEWNGTRERRVILTLPHPAHDPAAQHGMDSSVARKIGEMLIEAANKADALQPWEFKS
jgi:hypothetical protein